MTAREMGGLAKYRRRRATYAILAARGAVCVRERCRHGMLLVIRDTDAGVRNRQGDDTFGVIQGGSVCAPASGGRLGRKRDPARFRELERIAEQVVEDLLESLGISWDGLRQAWPK